MNNKMISENELVDMLFTNHNAKWNELYKWINESPVWERLYLNDGTLAYEGFTIDHKAYGPGTCFYPDGKPWQEGIWGIKGLQVGREYYSNGQIRYEGYYKLNQAYGPNEPVFGSFYDVNGKLKYYGRFQVIHGSTGYPMVVIPEEFGSIQGSHLASEYVFTWNDAGKLMNKETQD